MPRNAKSIVKKVDIPEKKVQAFDRVHIIIKRLNLKINNDGF